MFEGTHTALITPFRDGEVDEPALRALIERQIDAGIDGLVPCGSTGESATLSYAEHHRVVEITIEAAAGRVPVIAGTGSNSTREAIDITPAREAGGRRRRTAAVALLQQAHPGRHLPALRGDRARDRASARRLQHPRAHGLEYRARDDRSTRADREHRRREGELAATSTRSRMSWPPAPTISRSCPETTHSRCRCSRSAGRA